jgi:hypothetical protein
MSNVLPIIDRLALLETIQRFSGLDHKPLTARMLMTKNWWFASPFPMLRIDTLRMYLLRLTRKNILQRKRIDRSYGYILTKQGLKMIKYFKTKKAKLEQKRKMEAEQRNAQAALHNYVNQLMTVKALEQAEQEQMDTLQSILNILLEAKKR